MKPHILLKAAYIFKGFVLLRDIKCHCHKTVTQASVKPFPGYLDFLRKLPCVLSYRHAEHKKNLRIIIIWTPLYNTGRGDVILLLFPGSNWKQQYGGWAWFLEQEQEPEANNMHGKQGAWSCPAVTGSVPTQQGLWGIQFTILWHNTLLQNIPNTFTHWFYKWTCKLKFAGNVYSPLALKWRVL